MTTLDPGPPQHHSTPLPLGHVAGRVHGAHEDRLELAHARVGEQQRGVVQGDGGGGVDILVLFLGGEEMPYWKRGGKTLRSGLFSNKYCGIKSSFDRYGT